MFTTRKQVTDYLVAQGNLPGFVNALVLEYLNHDVVDHDQRDYIWRDPELDVGSHGCEALADYQPQPEDEANGMVPVQVTEAWCDDFYRRQADMLELTDTGIKFDGEECFTFDGNYKIDERMAAVGNINIHDFIAKIAAADAVTLKHYMIEYFGESTHQSWDGWDVNDIPVINRLMTDFAIGLATMQRPQCTYSIFGVTVDPTK